MGEGSRKWAVLPEIQQKCVYCQETEFSLTGYYLIRREEQREGKLVIDKEIAVTPISSDNGSFDSVLASVLLQTQLLSDLVFVLIYPGHEWVCLRLVFYEIVYVQQDTMAR